jgi:hypothetical protein
LSNEWAGVIKMKLQLVYKFKDGMIYTVPAYDVYDFTKPENGDFLKLMIKGKMDNQTLTLNGQVRRYSELDSIELKFIE